MNHHVVAGEISSEFAGNISPKEAWEMLAKNPRSILVDVRTAPEWVFIGGPDLRTLNKQTLTLSWRLYPQMQVNGNFIEELSQEAPEKDTPLLFLCRSGGRSFDAALAMAEQGYSRCYNIEGGFEGEPDAKGQRGKVNGWKAENIPWGQA